MDTKEIKQRQGRMHEVDRGHEADETVGVCFWLSEIALQMAEANELQAETNAMQNRQTNFIEQIKDLVREQVRS